MKELFDKTKQTMQKTIDALIREYGSIRAGRANPSVLDSILVDYYGTPTQINQMASVSVAESRILVIQPWDTSILNAIEKALQKSDIGINPQNDGKVIRLTFPSLTEDRRKEIAKEISQIAETSKISIRNARRDAIDALKKMEENADISEDDLHKGQDKIQKITDDFVKTIDETSAAKQKEVMEI